MEVRFLHNSQYSLEVLVAESGNVGFKDLSAVLNDKIDVFDEVGSLLRSQDFAQQEVSGRAMDIFVKQRIYYLMEKLGGAGEGGLVRCKKLRR